MGSRFFSYIEENPIIAALSNLENIDEVIKSPCKIVFLLKGDIMNLEEVVERLRSAGKFVCIHVDLIEGFSRHPVALEYIDKIINPDGIISTKSSIIKTAKNLGIFTIQRLFVLDSLALRTGKESINNIKPDAVEILPGLMPKVIEEVHKETRIPIIAGGLIRDKEDVIEALSAEAIGVSTSEVRVWYM